MLYMDSAGSSQLQVVKHTSTDIDCESVRALPHLLQRNTILQHVPGATQVFAVLHVNTVGGIIVDHSVNVSSSDGPALPLHLV